MNARPSRRLVALLLPLLLGLAPAPTPCARDDAPSVDAAAPVEAIVAEGTRHPQVMETLDELVNGIGPRLTGSPGLTQACAWARDRFAALGLDARLEPWGEVAVGFQRGPSRGALVAPEEQALTFITRAWSPGTPGPVRGRAVLAAEDGAALAARRGALPGAWVLIPQPTGDRPLDEEFLQARREAWEQAPVAGLVRPSPAGELLIMSGSRRALMGQRREADPPVSITVLASQFDGLVQRVEQGQAVELEFDVDNRLLAGPVPQVNVVAELPGSTWPEQSVIVCAHLDSWDGATGTTDNGTGVATTLEAARLLVRAGARPARTIRFILWTGEEQGLLGSRAWIEQHADELESISAVLNHDEGTNAISGLVVTRAMRPQLEQALAPVLAFADGQDGCAPFTLREVPGLVPGSSDHDAFLAAGVPAFSWTQTGPAVYARTHHTQHDTFDAALPDDERHSAVVVALAALGLADLPAPLSRRGLRRPVRRLGVFLADDGLTVRGVQAGSQAAAAGVEAGDRFVAVNGEPLEPGGLVAARDAGEGRKLLRWERPEAQGEPSVHEALFTWDPGDLDRDPEQLALHTDDGQDLVADYYLGAGDGPAAGSALILLPVNRGRRQQWMPAREALYRAGIATLAIDPRGHGESTGAEGELARRLEAGDLSLQAEMPRDVAAAVAWLQSRGYAPGRIGVMGASVGASVALRAVADDERLAGAACLTPGTAYLGLDSRQDLARWDGRPLLMVSSREEAGGGALPLHAQALAADPWAPVQLVLLDGTAIHGTRMLGAVPDIEQRLADWWARVLR